MEPVNLQTCFKANSKQSFFNKPKYPNLTFFVQYEPLRSKNGRFDIYGPLPNHLNHDYSLLNRFSTSKTQINEKQILAKKHKKQLSRPSHQLILLNQPRIKLHFSLKTDFEPNLITNIDKPIEAQKEYNLNFKECGSKRRTISPR